MDADAYPDGTFGVIGSVGLGDDTADGGLLVAGKTDTFGAGSADAWLLKLSRNGFVELHADGGTTATSLSGELVDIGLPGTDTDVVPQPLELVEEALEVELLSTQVAIERQGGLP